MRDNIKGIWILLATVLIVAGFCYVASEYRQAQITQAAMENGYEQEIVDGKLVWKRKGATAGEWVRWFVDEIKDFF